MSEQTKARGRAGARAADILARMAASEKRAVLWLTLLALALFLPGFAGLPPMDRDEPRFAQASRQMLETGDFIDIRFQEEARHKKPVGIYWAQSAIVAAAETVMGPQARQTIWLYRLPSLLGAVLAVLGTFFAARVFLARPMAFLAAGLFAATILIGVEARLAKTDALVTATVAIAMVVLARAWMAGRPHPAGEGIVAGPGPGQALVFWIAIGAGVLVKGPVTPIAPFFAALMLALLARSAGWLRALRPGMGLLVVMAMAAPWFIAILIKTNGAFLAEAVGQDMLGKVASGQESHGAPPGTYLLAFWGTAWPLAPFAALAVPFVWRARREPAVLFLLAWLVPAWLLFEAVPTKLPHYVLPLYPAIAIVTLLALSREALRQTGWWTVAARALILIVPLGLAAAAIGGAVYFGSLGDYDWRSGVSVSGVLAAFAMLALAVLAFRRAMEADFVAAMGLSIAAACAAYLLVLGALLSGLWFSPLAMSPRLAEAGRAAAGCPEPRYATVGFREPSLVLLTRSDLVMTDGAGAAQFLGLGACRVAFVESREEAAFRAALGERVDVALQGRVKGLNLNGGRRLDMGVYVRH